MKFALMLVSIILSPVIVASQFVDETESCFVQYLKGKGKLESSYQSTMEPPEDCAEKFSLMLESLQSFVYSKIQKDMPDNVECLMDTMITKDCLDHFIMIYVLRLNMFLSLDEIKIQLAATRDQLKSDLEAIALQCRVDDKNFVTIFHHNLGIRNQTLEVVQYEYCIAKFCVENKFLELDYEINPSNITTDHVNCTSIIDIDRYEAEKEFAEEYITTPTEIEAKDCIMQAYRDEKRYEWFAAVKVLGNEVNARRTKEADVIKVTEKLTGPSFTKLINDCISPYQKLTM